MTPYLQSRQGLFAVRVPAPEGNAARRPHPAATLEAVRQLVETTTLPLREVGRRTGVSAATISRKARRHGWTRPEAGLPHEPYTEAGRRALRRVALTEALIAQAEHLVFQHEMNPTAGSRLQHAMRLVRAARQLDAEERGARGRGVRRGGRSGR